MRGLVTKAGPLRFGPAFAVALAILALGLRAINLPWGAPLDAHTGYYHPDERKIVRGAVDFPADIRSRTDLRYPTAHHYGLGILTWPLRAILPRARPGADVFLAVFMIARAVAVALGVLTVLATYVLGRRWYGEVAGATAAALLAVIPIHVIHGAWATLDVPTGFWALVALWRCGALVARPGRRNTLLLAVASGLLIGTKYPGAVIVVPGVLAHAIAHRRAAAGGRWLTAALTDSILYLGLTTLVTLLTTPTILLHPEHLRAAVAYETERQGLAGLDHLLEGDFFQDILGGLETVAGRPLAWLMIAGAAAALARPTWREALLLSFLVPYYIVLGDRAGGRYLIILLPAYCLLAGRLAGAAVAYAERRRPVLAIAAAAAVAAVWLLGLRETAAALRLHHQTDARTEAARYLAEHALPGASVCVAQPAEAFPQDWKNPRIDEGRYRRVDCLERPDWVILSGGGEGRFERALASPHLQGDYGWDPAHADWWPDDRVPSPEWLRFYDDLFEGRDKARAYDEVAVYENVELPIAPFMVSRVRVYRKRLAPF